MKIPLVTSFSKPAQQPIISSSNAPDSVTALPNDGMINTAVDIKNISMPQLFSPNGTNETDPEKTRTTPCL